MTELEQAFHERMIELYHRALERTNGRYKATGFLMKVQEIGGLAAAKEWLHRDEEQSGFIRLYHEGILDESMEYVIWKERRWRPLFTTDERQIVRLRCQKYGVR